MAELVTCPDRVLELVERFERQIIAIDRQIDRLVYELHDLTDEGIEIVESSVRPL